MKTPSIATQLKQTLTPIDMKLAKQPEQAVAEVQRRAEVIQKAALRLAETAIIMHPGRSDDAAGNGLQRVFEHARDQAARQTGANAIYTHGGKAMLRRQLGALLDAAAQFKLGTDSLGEAMGKRAARMQIGNPAVEGLVNAMGSIARELDQVQRWFTGVCQNLEVIAAAANDASVARAYEAWKARAEDITRL